MTTAAKDTQGDLLVHHVKNEERMTAIIAIFEVRVSIMPDRGCKQQPLGNGHQGTGSSPKQMLRVPVVW
jgi:hypothetical protein